MSAAMQATAMNGLRKILPPYQANLADRQAKLSARLGDGFECRLLAPMQQATFDPVDQIELRRGDGGDDRQRGQGVAHLIELRRAVDEIPQALRRGQELAGEHADQGEADVESNGRDDPEKAANRTSVL